ncbi:hypothetical protein [Halorhabdus amylolytica]|uniref:hypothetical protein n=1 Tax=Halorhabdus amylolytica TaxID=2559573 RepID=UPI00145A167E|nr:hypothetical protein [Halorhabdus amylolytica]
MTTKCKLCRRPLDPSERERCVCGWAMDETCRERHGSWCPRGPGDRWIGVEEF